MRELLAALIAWFAVLGLGRRSHALGIMNRYIEVPTR